MSALRRLRAWWLRRTTACVTWPCARCNTAGRTSWRVRQDWHRERRDRLFGYYERAVLTLLLALTSTVALIAIVR